MAACNDWRNGDSLGVFSHSELTREPYGCVLELEHLDTTIGHDPKTLTLRVGRITVPYTYWKSWLGNWCWDGFSVREEDAAKIVNYLRSKRSAHCIGGDAVVFDKINGKMMILPEDLQMAASTR